MAVFALIFVTGLISFGFAKLSHSLYKGYRSISLKQNFPNPYIYAYLKFLKFTLPVIVVVLAFQSAAVGASAIYFLYRWVSGT